MWPTFQKINTNAIQPLDKGEITQSEFWQEAEKPIREFMIKDAKIQIRDVNLFAEISGQTYEDTDELSDVSFTTLVPAFILSELSIICSYVDGYDDASTDNDFIAV